MIFIIRNKLHVPDFAVKIITVVFWLFIWQAIYVFVGQEILVVSPACVFVRLCHLIADGGFWLTAFATMGRIMEGFIIGVLSGLVLAVFAARSHVCRTLMQPVVFIVKATPVASFIILALVWMHADFVPAFSASLIVFPIIWENVLEGIQKTDEKLLQMGQMFQFGKMKTAGRIYVPSVAPYFTAACTTGLGLSWKGGVAAEVLSDLPFSVGGHIYDSKIYLETADLFAWTAVVIIFSVFLEFLMKRLMKAATDKFSLNI
jgi:NitT/TauT family transport system permease protein